jgi:hypothetical protein
MIRSLGICMQRGCDEPATETIAVEGTDKVTGERVAKNVALCRFHYEDATTPCAADDCDALGAFVIAITGHALDGTQREDEVRFCEAHWEQFQRSAAMTVNGVRMIHDGNGRLKALRDNIGQG